MDVINAEQVTYDISSNLANSLTRIPRPVSLRKQALAQ